MPPSLMLLINPLVPHIPANLVLSWCVLTDSSGLLSESQTWNWKLPHDYPLIDDVPYIFQLFSYVLNLSK